MAKKSTTCRIDGAVVSRKEFDRVFATHKETGGWYCDETTTGGETGWETVDPKGVKYRFTAVTDVKEDTLTLERLP